MQPLEKNSPPGLKNWKVKSETLRQVNIECARLDLKQYELAEKALQSLSQAIPGPALAPTLALSSAPNLEGYVIDRDFLRWLLEVVMDHNTPLVAAVEQNLMLLAFGLIAAKGHSAQELRSTLLLLYERGKSQQNGKEATKPKRPRVAS